MRKKRRALKKLISGTSIIVLASCAQMEKPDPRPLLGKDVTEHSLADGKIGLKMKVTGLTSSVWLTAELKNNSNEPVNYSAKDLLVFDHQECVREFEYEENKTGTLQPNERVLLRYSFLNVANQKNRNDFDASCRNIPTKLQVQGLTVGANVVDPVHITIE